MSTFESAMTRLPHQVQANVNFQLTKLASGEYLKGITPEEATDADIEVAIKKYKDHVIANRTNHAKILFYPDFFSAEQRSIDMQIFHLKHDRVVRKGMKCSFCGSTNTKMEQHQRRSGDEAMTTEIYCYDCHRVTKY